MKLKKKYNHKYRLIYKIDKQPKGITKQKVPEGFGACDAVLFCSMIYPPDGSFSVYFMGIDGRKEEVGNFENLKDIEWFKVWCLLASRLAASKTLEDNRKELCRQTFEGIRRAIWGAGLTEELEKKTNGNGPGSRN
jgi:hypothetical protein